MFGIYAYGSIPFCPVHSGSSEAGGLNYRHLILRALKQNLEAVKIANGFSVDIKHVIFGHPEHHLKSEEILIYGIRDAAVMTPHSEAADSGSNLPAESSRIRNIYVKLRILVKGGPCSEITDEIVGLRENYTDALIKALNGRYAPARQLYRLLLEGISKGSGLTAFDISLFKEYGFAGDLELEAEVMFTYKEKFD